MEQWEHTWIRGDDVDQLQAKMNELGREGWHLVGIQVPSGGYHGSNTYWLRRRTR